MPAQSPTLSPTLSAITAGLRGSSSGMPASILPTRSAPTSAALGKMAPPSRANTEISEPPKASPASAVVASVGALREEPPAEPREHRDQRAAEGEPDQRVDRLVLREVESRG